MTRAPFVGVVVLLAGCSHTLKGPCPEIDAVYNPDSPERAALVVSTLTTELTVDGAAFEVLPDGGIKDGDADVPSGYLVLGDQRVSVDVIWVSDDELALVVNPSDPPLPDGLYDLVIENPSGCDARLAESVEVRATAFDDSIVIEEIIPPFGWTEEATAVTIRGSGFVSTPRAWLSTGDTLRDWEIEQLAFIDGNSLIGVVPAGLPVGGPYDLIVENPDGGYNWLQDAFTVTQEAPPDIFTLFPEAGETQDDTPVVITGENFDPGVTVTLYDIAGTEVAATVDSATSTEIQATFPTSGELSVGAWIVRATNEDGTWDEHAAFVVRNPSAKLGTVGAWAESEPLNQARVGLGVVTHIDPLGRGYLYAVAGSDGSAPLDTVERANTDAFGTLAGWEVLATRLVTPRAHGGVFELDGWVYAVGGDDGSGPTDTIERARILTGDSDHRPTITEALVEEGAGTLASGTWYYRVAGVMGAGDPENPGGETPASASYVVRVDRDNSAVTLSWSAVGGATHYRVYRTDAPNGASGEEHRIADDVASTSFVDDGKPAGTETFVGDGALGEWALLTETLPSPWARGALVKALDPNGDAIVYLVGGTDGAGPTGDVIRRATNGTWSVVDTLATPRMDNMATAAGFDQAHNLGAGSPTYLLAMEGDTGGAGVTNDIVFAPIENGGTLGPWQPLSRLNSGGQARVDGVGLAAAGHLYILGGGTASGEADTSGRQSEVQGPVMDLGSWSSTSASGTFAVPRADFGLSLLRATLYAIGGHNGTDAATTSVEQVVF